MRTAWLFVLILVGASPCFGAEVYPSKSVRMLVGSAPGGTPDMVARLISKQLSEQVGQTFVVDNRTGATSGIAYEIVVKSAPDGYTVMMTSPTITAQPSMSKSFPYDAIKDFTFITQVMRAPEVLVVHPSLNVNTLKEFIALARANPGKFNYGSGGTGGATHLWSELFNQVAKVNVTHIPYKGGAPAMNALLSGEIQMQIVSIPAVLAHVKSGRLRALAVTTDGKRSPSMPDVPSMSEAGVSGMTIYVWNGLIGPARMPKEVVNKLRAEVVKANAVPSLKELFMAQDFEPVGSSPEEFAKLIRDEIPRWAAVMKSAGITPE
jgi:tripartite-type tricarboxylate transporter receptor subunit TctC